MGIHYSYLKSDILIEHKTRFGYVFLSPFLKGYIRKLGIACAGIQNNLQDIFKLLCLKAQNTIS